MSETYICYLHKTLHQGIKRECFAEKTQTFLLNASLKDAYLFYKTIRHGCDCPENYKKFDEIMEEQLKSSKSSKSSESSKSSQLKENTNKEKE